jgi:hypothetical protein
VLQDLLDEAVVGRGSAMGAEVLQPERLLILLNRPLVRLIRLLPLLLLNQP